MSTQSIERQVGDRLAESGVRYTRGRRAVVAALIAGDGPQSAAELHTDIGDRVPLSSLYRTLAVLEEAGVVAPHHGDREVMRYELAEWLTGHHHHVLCTSCGSVSDVDLDDASERAVHEAVARVAGAAGFVPTGHSLEIDGVCRECR